jgi:hypothetical protein
VVRIKRADLKDIQGRLRDQLKVCQEEIGLGGRWGRAGSSLRPSDPAGDSVHELLEDVLAKKGTKALPKVEPPPDPSTLLQTDFPLVEFLGDPSTPTDKVLEILPEESAVPEVPHPDSNMFTDAGVDELLSRL